MTMMSTYVYGEPRYLPVDENHPVIGMSPYHQSKIACEELCSFYNRQFGIKCSVLRPFNVYGKGQNPQFLLPHIYNQVIDNNKNKIVVNDLEPKRDFIYVDDVVDAIISTLNSPAGYSVYNVGSGLSISVEEAIISISKALGIQKPYCSVNQKRQAEISDCVADISKIKNELGFSPSFTLEDGVKAWYAEDIRETK